MLPFMADSMLICLENPMKSQKQNKALEFCEPILKCILKCKRYKMAKTILNQQN